MKIILVGTDFGPTSDRALAKALHLAQQTQERIHLLHVVEPVDDPDSEDKETQQFYAQLMQRAQEKFQAQESSSEGVTHSVEIGPRVETIVRVAEEMQAELIVLGSQPLTEGNPPRLGVSHRIALTSTRPVLLVP